MPSHLIRHLDKGDLSYILIRDYMQYRLTKNNKIWFSYDCRELQFLSGESHCVLTVIRNLSDAYEPLVSDYLNYIASNMQFTPNTLFDKLFDFCTQYFVNDICWGRICALFMFAGSLAVRLHDQNMPQLIERVATSIAYFTQEYLSTWIRQQGGWENLIEFQTSLKSKDSFRFRWYKNVLRCCLSLGCGFAVGACIGLAIKRIWS